MIILTVDVTRFYSEYQRFVLGTPHNRINWFVDPDNMVHLFIITVHGFGYHFKCPSNEIPVVIRPLIDKEGAILGFYDIEEDEEEKPEISDILRLLPEKLRNL